MSWFEVLTPWHWLTFAVVLIVIEMTMGTYFLLWVGFAAATTALVQAVLGISWQVQMVVFFVLSLVSVVAWHYYAKNNPDKDPLPNLNRRGHQHIGRTFNLSHAIENGVGKINVNDSSWKVEGEEDLPQGARVKVIAIEGTVLKVEKA
ncbi:MAG: NfeD family protein [Gammaproteobacteria bacterium]|nr:NfeD family protein [Xanthomonadales bacterium]